MSNPILNILRSKFPQLAEKKLQDELAAVGQIHHFKAGELIMDFGNFIRMVPLVVEGSIKVVKDSDDGREIFLYFLQPGESCTMSFTCCMMRKKSVIRTTAEEDTTIIGIPIKLMDEWMSRYQSWKNFVMLSYDKRMNELIQVIDAIAFQQMDERLLQYLKNKASINQSSILKTTHQTIAQDLNASREAISRLLKQLEKLGKVKLGRNKIELM